MFKTTRMNDRKSVDHDKYSNGKIKRIKNNENNAFMIAGRTSGIKPSTLQKHTLDLPVR